MSLTFKIQGGTVLRVRLRAPPPPDNTIGYEMLDRENGVKKGDMMFAITQIYHISI